MTLFRDGNPVESGSIAVTACRGAVGPQQAKGGSAKVLLVVVCQRRKVWVGPSLALLEVMPVEGARDVLQHGLSFHSRRTLRVVQVPLGDFDGRLDDFLLEHFTGTEDCAACVGVYVARALRAHFLVGECDGHTEDRTIHPERVDQPRGVKLHFAHLNRWVFRAVGKKAKALTELYLGLLRYAALPLEFVQRVRCWAFCCAADSTSK